MNRRTNLFYLSGNDSKFLTFDNYSEALTGDILATDWKLYPSRFLCIKIDNLNKDELIKFLSTRYENKLAFLRDQDKEDELLPLNYLLEYLILYASIKNENKYSTIEDIHTSIINSTFEEDGIHFKYISDIVEQDYNGTYADIICTITPNKRQKFKINKNNDITIDDIESIEYNHSVNCLYGWENDSIKEDMVEYIKGTNIIELDTQDNYYLGSSIKNIEEISFSDEDILEFNIIIPLFDITNINSNSVQILEESEDNESSSILILNNQKNVPLGIYFTDGLIKLDQDLDTKFSSNWSLLISMQFKSFPFSYDIMNSWDNSDNIKDAYLTFAQILSKQTNFIDLLNRYNELITGLQNKISKLESGVSNISSVSNIDELSQRINNLSSQLTNKMTEVNDKLTKFEKYVESSKLKWAIKNRNN